MRRFCWLLGLSIGVAACRIERTPEEFIDQPSPAGEDLAATQAEIRDRLIRVANALREGSTPALMNSLAPHPDGVVLGPDLPAPSPAEQLVSVLQSELGGQLLSASDIVVDVDSTNRTAWFLARFTAPGNAVEDSTTRGFDLSGVFIRQMGEWRLVQGHITPLLILSPAPPPQTSQP